MTHDSVNERARQLPVPTQQQLVTYMTEKSLALGPAGSRRGKPATLTALHLCLGIVLSGLEGLGSQLALWRRLCLEPMGPFAPVHVVDQAVYNRLERAAGAMRAFFEQISGWMSEQLVGLEERNLAPWASQVLALDESTLDAVGRWLPQLRRLVPGDPGLLAGRISALFDLRRQQWVRVEVWQEAVANCKQQARVLIERLQAGTLLLVDRGYLSFPWFDELTERGLWWISRYANHESRAGAPYPLSRGWGLGCHRVAGQVPGGSGQIGGAAGAVLSPGAAASLLHQCAGPDPALIGRHCPTVRTQVGYRTGLRRAQRAPACQPALECQMGSRAGANLVCVAPGPGVSWLAGATGRPGGRGPLRCLHRPVGGSGAASAAAGHRSLAVFGPTGTRARSHSAQFAHPDRGAVGGPVLDHARATGSRAATRDGPLCSAQVCARASVLGQESRVRDALFDFVGVNG